MTAPTLSDFLLARIAEDEERARAATPGPWGDPEEDFGYGDFGWYVHGCPAGETEDSERGRADIKFIAHNHPARVLARCEADRRIVEALIDAEEATSGYDSDDPNNPPSYWQEWGNRHALQLAAELLALPYADHPDYDESWRP